MRGIRVIVGLGNPGAEYRRNRHNAGFHFLEALAFQCKVRLRRQSKLYGSIAQVTIAGCEVTLFRPETFMNRSARAVQAVVDFCNIEPLQMLVAHDEIDFPVAQIRLKMGGGHGGHNGLRDITAHLGKDFWRLRIGIGHPGDRRLVISHVLGNMEAGERAAIGKNLERTLAVVPSLVRGEFDQALRDLHAVD